MTENQLDIIEQIRAQFAEMTHAVARLSLENGTNQYRKLVAEDKLKDTQDKLAVAEGLALVDPLTGAYNRRGGEQAFEILHGQAQREGHMLAMIMLDLDRFKSVNDTYGHKAGDMVLIELVRRLKKPKNGQKALRENDVLARMGGEEFAILIPVKNADEAFLVADKARQIIKATPFEITDNKNNVVQLPVTASLGIATCTPTQEARCDLGDMQKSADTALYKAKEAGRDRTMIFEDKPSAPKAAKKTKTASPLNKEEIDFIMTGKPAHRPRGRKGNNSHAPAPGGRGA